MRALAGLNSQQEKAVSAVDTHLLVVAGAGSGKTRVLTHKIAYLIENCGYSPTQIVAMTFSNKAAGEMRERVHQLLPSYEQPQWIGTFHSICLRILKEFAHEAGLPSHFTIYDESDQLSALKRILTEFNFDPKQLPPKVIRYHIDRAKNQTDHVFGYLSNSGALTDRGLQVVKRYEEVLVQNNALDFGSLLTRTVRLLRENQKVAATLRERWPRILIDEYQDTNQIQKELVRSLAGDMGIVCAVGDEDQSIYGWRGARVENILEFETDFPGAQLVKLEQNYRSTQRILAAANGVISKNIGRRGKELWTENGEGNLPTFFQASDDHGEAAWVLDKVDELVRKGVATAKEISIFYRTHMQSRLLEDECRRRNRPYRIFGGVRFYDRAEIKDVLAFLNLALNPSDNISFTRIINAPARGIGAKTLDRLATEANSKGMSMFAAIPQFEGSGKGEKGLRAFYQWFAPMIPMILPLPPAKAAETILKKSGYLEALEKENTIESDSRIENIEELLVSMEEFSEEFDGGLIEYLDRISLISDIDSFDPNADTLTLMTMHNSKGLEFNVVFVVGMEEGLFPHLRSLESGDREEMEEERRLCYVAMTRARKELFLSAAFRRRLYQSTQFNPVSRFIGEIPPSFLLQFTEDAPATTVSSHFSRPSGAWRSKPVRKPYDEYRQESYDDVFPASSQGPSTSEEFPPGTRVNHPQFGEGTVRRCEGNPDNLKLTVQFQRGGLKKIMLNYTTLERI